MVHMVVTGAVFGIASLFCPSWFRILGCVLDLLLILARNDFVKASMFFGCGSARD